jgi:hypothetical protein
MVSKRSSRKARKPQRKTHTSQQGRGGSSLDARLKAPPGAGGPIRNIHPSARVLQGLIPPLSAVLVKSGIVSRGEMLLRGRKRLPGFRWDVPAPDPSLGTVLWATLGFDWVFYSWRSTYPKNYSDQKIRFNGSLQWVWLLTGHPDVFPAAPIFLTDGGLYSFYWDLAPGDAGFDVGWLTPPLSGYYSSQPDKIDPSMTSPLQRLLAMNVNGVLMLWFAWDIRNQVGGGTIDGGPNVLYYSYAYAAAAGSMASEQALALSNS